MNPAPRRSRLEMLSGLLGGAGLLLLMSALPVGIEMVLLLHYKSHLDMRVALLGGASLTSCAVIVGSLFLWICICQARRRRAASGKQASKQEPMQ